MADRVELVIRALKLILSPDWGKSEEAKHPSSTEQKTHFDRQTDSGDQSVDL